MGVLKLGSLIKFIPRPVTVGFTAGIAVIIFTGQIGNFLGLTGLGQHEYLLDTLKDIAVHLHTFSFASILVALISLVLILLTPKIAPKVPGALVGIIVSAVATAIF